MTKKKVKTKSKAKPKKDKPQSKKKPIQKNPVTKKSPTKPAKKPPAVKSTRAKSKTTKKHNKPKRRAKPINPPTKTVNGIEFFGSRRDARKLLRQGAERRKPSETLEEADDLYSSIAGAEYFVIVQEKDKMGRPSFVPFFIPSRWSKAKPKRSSPRKSTAKKTKTTSKRNRSRGSGSRFRQ